MRGEKILLTCEKCGKQFIRYKSMINPGITHFFCSRACAKEHLSTKMTKMNEDLNPIRMDNLEVLSSQAEHAKLHCKDGRFSKC